MANDAKRARLFQSELRQRARLSIIWLVPREENILQSGFWFTQVSFFDKEIFAYLLVVRSPFIYLPSTATRVLSARSTGTWIWRNSSVASTIPKEQLTWRISTSSIYWKCAHSPKLRPTFQGSSISPATEKKTNLWKNLFQNCLTVWSTFRCTSTRRSFSKENEPAFWRKSFDHASIMLRRLSIALPAKNAVSGASYKLTVSELHSRYLGTSRWHFDACIKILFTPAEITDYKLDRNEVVAMFNAFARLSSSIHYLDRFQKMLQNQQLKSSSQSTMSKGSNLKLDL